MQKWDETITKTMFYQAESVGRIFLATTVMEGRIGSAKNPP
jgi:hypothetical protein